MCCELYEVGRLKWCAGDDVTANDVIRINRHRNEKNINLSSIVITDVELASYLKKGLEFCFSVLW